MFGLVADVRQASVAQQGASALLRLAGAGLVGLAVVALGTQAVLAVLFGAWGVAATLSLFSSAVSVAGLVLTYRLTGGRASALRWAAFVTAGGLGLAATGAAAWWLSGQDVGHRPGLWQGALATAFVLSAGVGTRATRLPAALLAGTAALTISAVLAPAAASLLPEPEQRGCIASSAQEAARECP